MLIENGLTKCPLCGGKASTFYNYDKRHYFKCMTCNGIFLDKNLWLTKVNERARYNAHNNDVEDKNYQQFVSPITAAVLRDFTVNHKGLDFGAGTGPVISKVLKDNNFQIVQYDPFFHNHKHLLKSKYNYTVCCEVIEHFHNPKKEFELLKKLMLPKAKLYCMTDLYDDSMDFHNWYYKNDPSHVFIYLKKTIYWIKDNLGFSSVNIEGRLVTFT